MQCRANETPKLEQKVRDAQYQPDHDGRVQLQVKLPGHLSVDEPEIEGMYAKIVRVDKREQAVQPVSEMAHHPVGPEIGARGRRHNGMKNIPKKYERDDRKYQDEKRRAYNMPAQRFQMFEKRHFGLHVLAFFPDRTDQPISPTCHFFKIKYRCAAPANIYT